MTPAEHKPDSSLNEEHRLAQRLIELLQQEQAQLVKADIDGLKTVTEEKARAVNNMVELTNLRYQALAAAGFAAGEEGMQAWLQQNADNNAEACWQALVKLAQTAKALNSTNGLLISKHMSHNQKALNILQGPRTASFYGPNGQSTTKIGSRGFVVG